MGREKKQNVLAYYSSSDSGMTCIQPRGALLKLGLFNMSSKPVMVSSAVSNPENASFSNGPPNGVGVLEKVQIECCSACKQYVNSSLDEKNIPLSERITYRNCSILAIVLLCSQSSSSLGSTFLALFKREK